MFIKCSGTKIAGVYDRKKLGSKTPMALLWGTKEPEFTGSTSNNFRAPAEAGLRGLRCFTGTLSLMLCSLLFCINL